MQEQSTRWQRRVGYAMLLGMAMLPRAVWACAVCWGGDDGLARGMNASILFLMSMPFLIGGSIFGVIFVAYKRAQGQSWPSLVTKGVAWSKRRKDRE